MDNVIHIVDDDEAVRESLSFLLQTAGHAARTHASAEAFADALAGIEGGCVVTDVRMPGMSGIDLLRLVRASGKLIPVIVITGHGDVPLAVEAMKLGAADFLEKPFDEDKLLAAVHGALESRRKEAEASAGREAHAERYATLSNRERQVFRRLVEGEQNKTIAHDLGISPRTVEVYRANVMGKMRAASLSELVRISLTANLGDDEA